MLKLLKPILVVPLAAALLLVACEDAPAASAPDVVQADVPVDIAGTDAVAPGTDASADTLTGETDAVAASDVAQGCASPCIDSDDNPCTFVVCEQGSCVQKVLADGSVCEDGDPCTTADRCGGGSCKPSTEPASNVCACDSNADCAAFDDGLACNGQFFCDKGSFPYICKVNPATVPPCEGQTPPSTCLVAACAEPTSAGGKPQCSWKPIANGTACDDKNPLTEGDTCLEGVCAAGQFIGSCQSNSDCTSFEDGNLCNGQLFCNKAKGKCQLNPATVIVCPTGDDTTCQKNVCEAASGKCAMQAVAEGEGCDDGNTCTTGEICKQGACSGATNTCKCTADADCAGQEDGNLCNGTLYCELSSGTCQLNPATVVACGDNANPCETMACVPATGACEAKPALDGTPCNADNTLCTLADACQAGKCVAGDNLCKCAKSADCALYEDGDACNGKLYCNLSAGACELNPSSVVTCNSELDTPCAKQVCVPLSGECTAVVQNEGGGCDDGNVCTLGDTCTAGACTSGQAACVCATDADCAEEEDGNVCNGTLYCDAASGTCKVNPSTIIYCEDPDAADCTAVACQPSSGLCVEQQAAIGAPCSDGNTCTAGEICGQGGVCGGGESTCGCKSDADCALFDDGNACNGKVICDKGAAPDGQCKLEPAPQCPAKTCQTSSCEPTTGGCEYVEDPDGTGCDDGEPCTDKDACNRGGCAGVPLPCDDGNPCTADLCAAGTCEHPSTADGLPCDVEPCSLSSACVAGSCVQKPKDCDDLNPCTADSCDSASGACQHPATGLPCDDGDICTTGDDCETGDCTGDAVDCSVADTCQAGVCDSQAGCVTQPKPDGTSCDDNDLCSLVDACKAGACVGGKIKICDDGDPCTSDPGCTKSLVAQGGCSPGLSDNNPMTYWTTFAPLPDGYYDLVSFAYNSIADTWAAVGGVSGSVAADLHIRLWAGSNAVGNEVLVSYPGKHVPFVVAASIDSGWLVGGSTGAGGDWQEQDAKPFLARLDAAGQLVWASSTLDTAAVIRSIAPLGASDPAASTSVVVAGTRGANSDELYAKLWLAEVDVSGVAPKLVHSAECASGNSSIGLYGSRVIRLTSGDWVVSGHAWSPYQDWYERFPVWCRFDSNFQLVQGPVFNRDNDGGLELTISDTHARPDGGFWALLTGNGLSVWRAYDKNGTRTFDSEEPSGMERGLPVDDGMYLAHNTDSGAEVMLDVLGTVMQTDAVLITRSNSTLVGILRDKYGISMLFSDWGMGYTFVHTDGDLSQTCNAAQTCPSSCEDGDACTIDFCQSAVCVNEVASCDDENPCTSDSCSAKGCSFFPTTGNEVCDDGAECTVTDTCHQGVCKGVSRFGTTTTQVAATEQIVDGVVHGDGLLVLGHKLVGGVQTIFWRKYGPLRTVLAEGLVGAGTPVTLARSAAALQTIGVFELNERVAVLYRDASGNEQLGMLSVDSQYLEPVLGTLSASEATIAAGDVIQSGETVWVVRTQGVLAGEVLKTESTAGAMPVATITRAGYELVGLRPWGVSWLALYRSDDATSILVELFDDSFTAAGKSWQQPVTNPLSGPLPCDFGARSLGRQMVVCGQFAAYLVNTDAGYPMGDSLALLIGTEGTSSSVHAGLDANRVATLRPQSSDGEWMILLHDGVFNEAGSKSVSFLASGVPAFATSDLDIWAISETVGGNFREVTVHHYDKYANTSCEDSGSCYQENCEYGDMCTFPTCSAGSCEMLNIPFWGNCGTFGACSPGQCSVGGA